MSRQRKQKRLDAAGICVSAVGSPIGKIGIEDDFEAHMKKLQRIERIADIFETSYIRMFSFYLPEHLDPKDSRDEVMRRMECMVKRHRKIIWYCFTKMKKASMVTMQLDVWI